MPSKPIKDKKYTGKFANGRVKVNPVMEEFIISDHFGARVPMRALAIKYNLSDSTIFKIIDANRHKKEKYEQFDPAPIIAREKLPDLERVALLSNDAAQIIELTLALIKKRLLEEIGVEETEKNMKHPTRIDEDGKHYRESAKITTKDLAVLMAEITPYVMEKKVSPKAGAGTAKSADKKGQMLTMFKQQSK